MNDLQKEILKLFVEFDKICKKNNLKYFAIGGTCLGAVRHKGFIPWDDDIDVAMPYDDYQKFIKIAKNELPNKYRIIDYTEDNFYRNNFSKIENTQTTFVEECDFSVTGRYKGVFIDIMPICGISKNKLFSFFTKLNFYLLNVLDKNKKSFIFDKKTFKGKISFIVIKIISAFRERTYYSKRINKLREKNKICKNNNILFSWRIPYDGVYPFVFSYDLFESVIEVPFENVSILIPERYDEYLRIDFGDYMKLPPKSKRVSHLPMILDLSKSYVHYKEKNDKINNNKLMKGKK